MKVITMCNLPDGIKLDHAWFVAEDGLYAQKVTIRPLPQKIDDPDDDLLISRGWNACIDEIMRK